MAAKPTIKDIIGSFGGNEKLTKKRNTKEKVYNTLRDNIRLEEDAALMIDILELPTASFGYKYLLVATDIATREFDIEQIKNKDSETVLKAFQKMMKREYIDLPKYYLISDNGGEFKNVFHRYLWDNNIIHQQTLKGRHKSLSAVDSLIATLGRIFNAYMNAKEDKNQKSFRNWTDIVPMVRKELNKNRKVELPTDLKKDNSQALVDTTDTTLTIGKDKKLVETLKFKKPKYKIGDKVYRPLENPKNMLNKEQYGKFREGDVRMDKEQRKITEIVYLNGKGPTFRYILDGVPNVSYSETELRKTL